MKNYLSVAMWGLVAFFVATFLLIYIFYAINNQDDLVEEPPIEDSVDEEHDDGESLDGNYGDNKEKSNSDENGNSSVETPDESNG